MERIGVAFSRGLTPTEIVECVQLAEELGYESAWVPEAHPGDQFAILTACALATKRILLGTSISSVFVRSAPTIAMAAATVDHFSSGRFILGLGSSHRVQVEGEHGLAYSRPLQRVREYVNIIRRVLRDREVSYQGTLVTIAYFDLWFTPLRQEIPIYLGALNPKMLELCGEVAQGTLLVWCTLRQVRNATAHISQGAQRTGRSPEEVDVAAVLPCAVAADREEARARMRLPIATYAARFPRYRRVMVEAGFAEEVEAVREAWEAGDEARALRLVPAGLIDNIALAGTSDQCRERIDAYRQAGVTLPIVSPRLAGRDAKQQAIEVFRACAPR